MKKILLILFVIFGYFGVQYYNGYQKFINLEIVTQEQTIIIDKGTTPRSFLIDDFGLDEMYVKIFFKTTGLNPKIEAGKYALIPPVTVGNIFDKLNNPIIDGELELVIYEGWNMYDIDMCLARPESMERMVGNKKTGCLYESSGTEKKLVKKGLIEKGDFIQYITSQKTVKQFGNQYEFLSGAITLEGFLQPDTYRVNMYSFTLENFTARVLKNFDIKVMKDEDLLAKFGSELGKKVVDNIIIASIVEREISSPSTREQNEAEKVAGVLKKRLEDNWQIGADATVCYPYKILSQECTPNFVLEKLYEKTAYNTRQMTGLPKTPISNPYYKTIKSTLLSEKSEHYFYLHSPQGKIYYAKDNAGHEANKRKYLR